MDTLQSRIYRLEQLLQSAPERPPGASAAVATLESPAVSVVMPTHNRARYVGEAIESVLAQSFRDWELLVVDDGSEDDTRSVVARFLVDPRIRYLHQSNRGAPAARNAGIRASRGSFIAYLDDDNVWYPDFLKKAVDVLATRPEISLAYGALVTDIHNFHQERILWKNFDRALLETGNYIDTNVMVHRRSLVDAAGGGDESLKSLEDWELVLRYTRTEPAAAINVLAAYYRHCDDTRITKLQDYQRDEGAVLAKNGDRPPAS